MSQLRELAKPFHGKYVQKAPQGKYGDYVSHSTINERLLQAVGPFSFELVQVVRGHAEEIKTKNKTYAARENAVVGVVARLTATIDGRAVSIEEVGAEDSPAMKGDGDNLKTSMSDALKRCAMRLGLGLHLWSGDLYFLDRALERDTEQPAKPTPARAEKPVSEPETPPWPDTPAAPERPANGDLASDAQLKALAIAVKEYGFTKRDETIAFFTWLHGRPLKSSKQLTKAEASRVLDWDEDAWEAAKGDFATRDLPTDADTLVMSGDYDE